MVGNAWYKHEQVHSCASQYEPGGQDSRWLPEFRWRQGHHCNGSRDVAIHLPGNCNFRKENVALLEKNQVHAFIICQSATKFHGENCSPKWRKIRNILLVLFWGIPGGSTPAAIIISFRDHRCAQITEQSKAFKSTRIQNGQNSGMNGEKSWHWRKIR